jgi:hypothetical protein
MAAVSLMELRLIRVMFNTTPFMKRDDNVLFMYFYNPMLLL